MTDEEIFAHLQTLVRTMPQLGRRDAPPRDREALDWLGRLYAIIKKVDAYDAISVRTASSSLGSIGHERALMELSGALHRAVAVLELKLPAASRGAFIPVGHTFNALAAIAGIIGEAKQEVFFVDPYASEKILLNYAVQAAEGVRIKVLASAKMKRPGLLPAAEAWVEQYRDARPLVLRGALGGVLHDRAIVIDGTVAWSASQSFDEIAARAAATINRVEPIIAADQMTAFAEIFDAADPWIG